MVDLGRTDVTDLRVVVRRADYAILELLGWHEAVVGTLRGAIPDFVYDEVSPVDNRILLGITNADRYPVLVEEILDEHGIPASAVRVEESDPIVPLSSLKDRHRPVLGGLQIWFSRGLFSSATCTLTITGNNGGVSGFITNSHCSKNLGQVDGDEYWQPSKPLIGGSPIGTEVLDPPLFTGGVHCSPGYRCRFSDANFSTLSVDRDQGRIAYPERGNPTWRGAKFRVVGKDHFTNGTRIWKVGKTTGLTRATVTNTCANVIVEGTNILLPCQHLATAIDTPVSEPGDSGAPVFVIVDSPLVNDVVIGGIHWGGNPAGTLMVFSGFDWVDMELGSTRVCASANTC